MPDFVFEGLPMFDEQGYYTGHHINGGCRTHGGFQGYRPVANKNGRVASSIDLRYYCYDCRSG